MGKVIKLNLDEINKIDLTALEKYTSWQEKNAEYFVGVAGKEHYKLLAYLSCAIDEKFYIDIGTYYGFSAIALSSNSKSNVITYDVCDWIPDEEKNTAKTRSNVVCKIMNCVNDMDNILQSNLVIIDIDPHDGYEELLILNALRKHKYTGLVLLSDIFLNDEMKAFWNSIPEQKHDVTRFGHWSGTGVVAFDPSNIDIVQMQ